MNNHISGPSQLSQPSQNQTPILQNDGKSVEKQCLEGVMTKASQPAPLSTPPNSSTIFQITALQINGLDQHNIEKCRNKISELQDSIDGLQSKLRESEMKMPTPT